MADRESWDLEAIHDAEISPLMAKVIAICQAHRIPMVASFAYAHNAETGGTDFCTTAIPFEGREVENLEEARRAIMRQCHQAAFIITTVGPADETPGEEKK